MNKQIARNIALKSKGTFKYKVEVARRGKVIIESYETFEEAVQARDEIETRYEESAILSNSSLYVDRNLVLAKHRFSTEHIVQVKVGDSLRYGASCKCKKCCKEQIFVESRYYKNFIKRDSVCKDCDSSDRIKRAAKQMHNRKAPLSTNVTTGIKNVCYDQSNRDYRVAIMRDGRRLSLHAKTLKSAVALKSRVLNFYDSYGRLPALNEI